MSVCVSRTWTPLAARGRGRVAARWKDGSSSSSYTFIIPNLLSVFLFLPFKLRDISLGLCPLMSCTYYPGVCRTENDVPPVLLHVVMTTSYSEGVPMF